MSKKIKLVLIGAILLILAFVALFIFFGSKNENGVKPGDIIVGIGDSITAGGKSNEQFSEGESEYFADLGDGYFKIIADTLQSEVDDLTFYNTARSGSDAIGWTDRVFIHCLDFDPDVIIITLGANDFLYQDTDRYNNGLNFVSNAIFESNTKAVLIAPFAMEHYIEYPHTESPKPIEEIEEYYNIAKEISEGYGFAFIDIEAIFDEHIKNGTDPRELSEDGIHPTEKGEEILAEAVLLAIENL